MEALIGGHRSGYDNMLNVMFNYKFKHDIGEISIYVQGGRVLIQELVKASTTKLYATYVLPFPYH